MTKILFLVLFAIALLGAWFNGLTFVPPAWDPLAVMVVALICAALLLVVVPLVRSRRVHGIGIASLLRRSCRFAMLLALAFCFLVPGVQAQQVRKRAWTNLPPFVTSLAVSNVNANPFTLQRECGVGFGIEFAATNATGCTNLVALFDTTPDGTNWTTQPPLAGIAPGTNGTTRVFWMTNLIGGDIARLNNTYQIRLRALTNAGGSSVFITNGFWTYNND